MPSRGDWTSGAGKWAAVLLLGAVSAAGIGWGILKDVRTVPRRERIAADVATAPAVAAAESRPPREQSQPSTRELAAPKSPVDEGAALPTAAAVKINPNTASKPELELLPGVGPALAERIIAERGRAPFRALDDLGRVRGIGPKTLERLREHVVFE